MSPETVQGRVRLGPVDTTHRLGLSPHGGSCLPGTGSTVAPSCVGVALSAQPVGYGSRSRTTPPISGQPALSGDGHVRLRLRSEKPCVVPAPVPLKETRLHRLGPGSPVTSTPCTPCGEWLDLDRLAMWGDEPRNRRWTHARFHLRFQPRLRLSEPTSMWEWFGSPPREEVCSGSLGEPVRVHHLHPRHDSARPLGVEP